MSLSYKIINSILDNDLYKFTMQNAIIKHFPRAIVQYEFIDRNDTIYPPGFAELVDKEVQHMSHLVPDPIQIKAFEKMAGYFIDPSYFVYLMGYRFDSTQVESWQTEEGKLRIRVRGPWHSTVLWEVPLMSIVSELYFKVKYGLHMEPGTFVYKEIVEKSTEKARIILENKMSVVDFSTRRRASKLSQSIAIKTMKSSLKGTSNVLFGIENNLKLMGTHAHEWFMFMAAKYGYKMANSMALGKWADVYSGQLGIALTDTFTTDVFLHSFSHFYAKLFDGVRQDSGSEYEYTDKFIRHYEKLTIDPLSKSIVFSNSLTIPKALDIHKYCDGHIGKSFGVGTNISNDIDNIKPLNIVIKMTAARPFNGEWIDTVKIPDDIDKSSGNPDEVMLAKKILKI